jgi:ADP-ribosylglycohydrolase
MENRSMKCRVWRHGAWGLLALLAVCGPAAGANRTITAAELYDRLHGMWIGQLIGNAAGRATEGRYSGTEPDPCESISWQIKQVWDADDDTDLEYVALHILQTYGFDCNGAEIAGQWLEHMTDAGIYVATKQAWHLMLDGHLPPATGSRSFNEHWYSIDAQISTETLGAVSPGLPRVAADLAGRFGQVTNDGFAVDAARFYAVLYADAFFEPNVIELVRRGLEVIPPDSRTAQVVTDALDWYQQDSADGTLDWRATRHDLYEKYEGADSFGRYYNWTESTINVGATVLALLYGGGDFKRTVQIAVLAGWDCDCNPATAGGLLGIIHGFSGLPGDLTDPNVCGDVYENVSRPDLPDPNAALPQDATITAIASDMLALAQENIFVNGGSLTGEGDAAVYAIPEPNFPAAEPRSSDPNGPTGLVAEAPAAGITVTPAASVARYDHSRDRCNLDSIMDGVTDNSRNGHRPYYTYAPDLAGPTDRDWYALTFSQPVRFTGLTFYEGDVVWNKINTYYADDQPLGGFFEDLAVQVLRNGQCVEPAGLQMSEPLNRLQMYQTITFTFAPIVGQAIRIIGTPGGSKRFTTILELQAQGDLYDGPRVASLTIGDGEAPHTNVSTILLRFDEPVAIDLKDIELLRDSAAIDMQGAMLLCASPCRSVLLFLPEPLPSGTYELRLHCPVITDDFGLPLIDDDGDPNDSLWTTPFDVTE